MSHFATFVVLDEDVDNVDAAIEGLLAPYDENTEVPEYERDCWCVGRKAKTEASEAYDATWPCHGAEVEEQRSKISAFHEKLAAAVGPEFEDPFMTPIEEVIDCYVDQGAPEARVKDLRPEADELGRAWNALFERRDKFMADHFNVSDFKDKADPDCDECEGGGKEKTTYNPKSKWDWYQVGGRWTGMLSDYDPSMDAANKETCFLCGGTGKRSDTQVAGGCNGCDGTGIREKWPSQWEQHPGDICTAAEVLAKLDKKTTPYALLTPDGEWHERGEMGWWGMSSGDKPADDWTSEVQELLSKCSPGCAVAVVDCHI